MSRIGIRFAKPSAARRFIEAGRPAILVAEDAGKRIGMVQIVFAFPPGSTAREAANGSDTIYVPPAGDRAIVRTRAA